MSIEDGMPAKRRIIVVLPAFDEEKDLPGLLERIDVAMDEMGFEYRVLLVDDGSNDQTRAVAIEWSERIPIEVRSHERNQGLGATLRDGLEWACEVAKDNDIIVTLDADNSHTPELIARMARSVREGHDVVIASRFRRESRVKGVPWSRRVLSRAAAIVFKVMFPIEGVKDYTCGYRAYRAGLLQEATSDDPNFFDQDGFQAMVDVLLKLRQKKDLIFGEVPLILRYDLKEGESKMAIGATIANTLRLISRRAFR